MAGVDEIVREALDANLDPARVKQVRGKDYLAEHDVVRTANRIFGYGKWGTTVVWHELVGSAPMKNASGEDGWYTGYRCCVRLTVDGCEPVDGVGYGDAFEKQWSAQVTTHELAAKEAESDAIKRAFKKFGDQFGLILYAKAEDKRRIAAEKDEAAYNAPASKAAVDELQKLAEAKGKKDDVASLLIAEFEEHGCYRTGRVAAISTKLNALETSKPDVDLPEAAPKPIEQLANEPLRDLAEGDRWATDDEVSSAISLAATLDTDAAAQMSGAIIAHREKNVDKGCMYSYLQRLVDAVKTKIDEAGGVPENVAAFVLPESATKPATDGDVEAAFSDEAAA